MKLDFYIASRYLFAKKSQNVINVISAISAVGMAVGTAALIVVLSVYNGFDSLVKSMMSTVEPDIMVSPATGKYFVPDGEAYDWLYDNPQVASICGTLQENVFVLYENRQATALVKGVDGIYEEESRLGEHIVRGEFSLHRGDVPLACTGSVLAHCLGINPAFLAGIEIYYPSRTRRISAANPASSLESVTVWPSGVFSINSDVDGRLMIVPIETMRELLELEDEVSEVEIRLTEEAARSKSATARIIRELQDRLGEGFVVKDRFRQNESLYKMMRYEKAAVYMILVFMLIIISFNIFGSLSMLIIEKKDDIGTLRSLGAEDGLIRRIFRLEGWLITLSGLAAGTVLGIAVALVQQLFGIVRMPGSFLVEAYPVILNPTDVILVCLTVAAIGYIITIVPSRRAVEN